MDDNWRDVILGLGEIAGTLGGIWLGWVLQGRRRHDVAKREAYAQFVAVCSELSGVLRADRDAGGLGATAVREEAGDELRLALATIQIVGDTRVVVAAEKVTQAFPRWADAQDDTAWEAGRTYVEDGVRQFLQAARREIGQRARQ